MSEHPHPWVFHLFAVASCVAIGGWALLLGLLGWWQFQPAALPDVTEPIPVLNPGRQVAINTPVILRLEVAKPQEVNPSGSVRYLECESGNLVTLTPSPALPLPVGAYTVISDNIIIPAKVTAGDTCRAVFAITYTINPIRDEVQRFTSEPFHVLPAQSDTIGG
jgi:hypothetical protein